jgi:hypothetical protein
MARMGEIESVKSVKSVVEILRSFRFLVAVETKAVAGGRI